MLKLYFRDYDILEQIHIRSTDREVFIEYRIPGMLKEDMSAAMNNSLESVIPTTTMAPLTGNLEYFMSYYLPGETSPNSRVKYGFMLEEDEQIDL